ncbi:MAG: FAD-binding protein [Gemmobacter sp.]|nr:FAD-binding protein [Gemmobacter sp.]
MRDFDILIIGAGTAGMPCAIESVAAGARVLVVEQAAEPGGTLHVSLAQMSGAGTARQRSRGITDSPADHQADIERINRGTGRSDLLARATRLQAETVDWLMDNGFQMDPTCPQILYLHEAYRTPRTYWGIDRGISVLHVLRPLFDAAMARPGAQVRYRTEAVSLTTESGAVTGAVLRDLDTGRDHTVTAGAVVMASGGYGGNPDRFARWTGGRRLYTAAMDTSTGAGIEMAESIGAAVTGHDMFLPTYAGIVEHPDGHRIVWDHMPLLTPQGRQPWELHLTPEGRRFVQEDIDSVDARERALNDLPGLSFWCVFDDRILADAPPLLPGWSADELDDAWAGHASFVIADGLDDLARATGMDLAVLTETIAAYNLGQATGAADPMGRRHRPLPIEGPRYRAILMHGMVLKTPAGLAVDTDLRVLDDSARPIPNLYALGEAMGGSTLSGKAFVGGMSVTPALAFGRWLGQTLGARLQTGHQA